MLATDLRSAAHLGVVLQGGRVQLIALQLIVVQDEPAQIAHVGLEDNGDKVLVVVARDPARSWSSMQAHGPGFSS